MKAGVRNLAVKVDSSDALDVRRFDLKQRMSSLFEVTLLALSENPNIDFDAVVGQPASFEMHGGVTELAPARRWTGICKHIEQIAAEETGLSTYQIIRRCKRINSSTSPNSESAIRGAIWT